MVMISTLLHRAWDASSTLAQVSPTCQLAVRNSPLKTNSGPTTTRVAHGYIVFLAPSAFHLSSLSFPFHNLLSFPSNELHAAPRRATSGLCEFNLTGTTQRRCSNNRLRLTLPF